MAYAQQPYQPASGAASGYGQPSSGYGQTSPGYGQNDYLVNGPHESQQHDGYGQYDEYSANPYGGNAPAQDPYGFQEPTNPHHPASKSRRPTIGSENAGYMNGHPDPTHGYGNANPYQSTPSRPGTAAGNMQPSAPQTQSFSRPAPNAYDNGYSYNAHHSQDDPAAAQGYYAGGQDFNLPSRPGTAPGGSRQPQEEMPNFSKAPASASRQRGMTLHTENDGAVSNGAYGNGPSELDSGPIASVHEMAGDSPYQQNGYGQARPPQARGPPNFPQGQRPDLQRIPTGDTYHSDPGPNFDRGPISPVRSAGPGGYGPPGPNQRREPGRGRGPPPPSGGDPRRGPPRDPRDPRDPRGRGPAPGGRDPRSGPQGDPRDPRYRDARSRERGPPNGRPRGPPGAGPDSRSRSRPPPGGRPGPPGTPGSMPPGGARDGRGPRDPRDPPRPTTAPGTRPGPDSSRSFERARASEDSKPQRPGSDSLPYHPTPVRPGLADGEQNPHPAKPVPVRQYDGPGRNPSNATQGGGPPRASSKPQASAPITHEELARLRREYETRPADYKTHLHFAMKLVEAAKVLADEGGRADVRTRNKNREKYVYESRGIVKDLVGKGYPDAQFYLGDCLGSGALGLENDPKEAFALYQAAAKSGHAEAAYRTAICCEIGPDMGGGTRKDLLKAFQWYKRAAALGNQPSMYKVGMIQLKGLLGQEKSINEGVTWLKRAADHADLDNPHALHELAQLYEPNAAIRAVEPDDRRALSLFQEAANCGFKHSQFRLGQAYEYGMLGCPIDARQSIIWYTKAAAQGEHQSELALSGWYLTGSEGILEHSDTEAYLWARKAATAEPPLAKAIFALGYYTEVGIGCPRSLEEAKKWYSRAAANKFVKAQQRLDELKRGGANVQKNREELSRKNQKQQEQECTVM